jgi:CubicO group peptidase (beta-lactamase class C family)
MKKIKYLILATQLLYSGLSAADHKLQKLLASAHEKYKLPGSSLATITPETMDQEVYGVRKKGDPTKVTKDDKFHLGSCTKSMTSSLIAIFVEKGKIKWENTMEELFPELADKMHSDTKKITLAMLTSHQSGITENLIKKHLSKDVEEKITTLSPREGRKKALEIALGLKPEYKPGTKLSYSNHGYIIAGAALEKITDQSWEDLTRKYIFEPLEMKSCGFGPQYSASATPPDQPWAHVTSKKGIFPFPGNKAYDNPLLLGPAGIVHCTPSDWAKFVRIHLDGANNKDTTILKARSFKLLHTPYPGSEYAPGGLVVDKVKQTLRHTGSNLNNFAEFVIYPSKNLAILFNTNVGGNKDFSIKPGMNASEYIFKALEKDLDKK